MVTKKVLVSPAELRREIAHRPFALPTNRPWVMAQTWQGLLFAHWPVPIETLRPLIPPELTLDTYDGEAWISIVPFLMNNVRLRTLAPIPGTARFPELNVRTYVSYEDKPGVWFLSLDAANPLAVWAARRTYNLPYYNALMQIRTSGEEIHYTSKRTHHGAAAAEFRARFAPCGPVQNYPDDSLDRWLTDRYVLYSANRSRKVFIGHITHLPWPTQPAEAEIEANTMAQAAGIQLPDTSPLLHYSHQLDILAWAIQPIRSGSHL